MSAARVIPLHPQQEAYLSKRQLAALLGFSTRWIELRVREGMPAHRFGSRVRFRLSEVEGWLEGR